MKTPIVNEDLLAAKIERRAMSRQILRAFQRVIVDLANMSKRDQATARGLPKSGDEPRPMTADEIKLLQRYLD